MLLLKVLTCICMKTEFKTKYIFSEQQNKNKVDCLLLYNMFIYCLKKENYLFSNLKYRRLQMQFPFISDTTAMNTLNIASHCPSFKV